ncbi:MAG: heme-binding protein [Beijerinckiaceae bacterium]|nr:heme-binding protein [Beijerinckiaceae bacterium]
MPDFIATHRLTHEAALKMIAAGIGKAAELGCQVSLAVVDASCQQIAVVKMDGARLFSLRATIKKALTAASQRVPTGYAPDEDVVSLQIRMDGDFTNVPGGFPVVHNGQVVGAVAAGGATREEDVVIAEAALAALMRQD